MSCVCGHGLELHTPTYAPGSTKPKAGRCQGDYCDCVVYVKLKLIDEPKMSDEDVASFQAMLGRFPTIPEEVKLLIAFRKAISALQEIADLPESRLDEAPSIARHALDA